MGAESTEVTFLCNSLSFKPGGSSNQKVSRDFRPFFAIAWQKIHTKFVCFNWAILLPNCSLKLYIAPSWELRGGNETFGGSHFFVKVCSEI